MAMNRRQFVKTTAIAAMGLAARPLVAIGADSVSLLLGATMSGVYAETGMHYIQGVKLAIEHYGGKVLGRPIELVERDMPNPSDGVLKAQEAVERLGVKFLTVGPSSPTVLAVGEYAAKKGVVLFSHAGSDKITGSACNRFTFRWQMPTWGAVREVVPRIAKEYKAKTFFTITPKYVFGEDLLRNTEEVMAAEGLKLLDNSFHPMGEADFSSHITKAMASKADCVLFLNFGGDTVNALKQATNFGLSQAARIACVWGSGVTQMKAVGPEALEGVIWGLQYYQDIDTPLNKKLVAAYSQKYKAVPTYDAASVYATTMTILSAIDRAKTDDPAKVAAAIEDFEQDSIIGKEVYRKCDHQCLKPYYTVRCKKVSAMKHPEDYADIIGQSSQYLPCDKTGCTM